MTTTKVKKITAKSKTASELPASEIPITGTIVAFNDPALRSLSVLAASMLFQAPQFTLQATPASILQLAETMYNYMIGKTQEQAADTPEKEAPKFG